MRWKGKEQRSKTIPALCRIPDTHGGLAALIATLHGQPVLSRTPQARQSRLSLTGLIGCATYVFQKANYGWLALLCPFRLGKFFQSSSILGLTFYLQALKIYLTSFQLCAASSLTGVQLRRTKKTANPTELEGASYERKKCTLNTAIKTEAHGLAGDA